MWKSWTKSNSASGEALHHHTQKLMTTTVGEQLRKAREQKRLTVEQAAFATHIKPEYLRALEMDEREVIPSFVQAKGFLRLYADYLSLEIRPLLDQWNGISVVNAPANEDEFPIIKPEIVEHPDSDTELLPVELEEEGNPLDAEMAASFEIQEVSSSDLGMTFPPVAEEYLKSIGGQLRERRQTAGLQHSDVEKFIHIRPHYLKALEDGRIDILPSIVQGQGMLANYARFLELDVENLLLQYATALQARREALQPPPSGEKRVILRNTGKFGRGLGKYLSADLIISGGVIIGLLAFAIWAAFSVSNTRNQAAQQTPVSISELLLTTVEQTLSATELSIQDTSIPTSVLQNESDGNPAVATLAPVTTPGLEGSAPIQITVIGRQRTWLKVVADGKEVINDRVVPGNAYSFSAENNIDLSAGDASGIQIVYNGQDLGSIGSIGQVISLTFNLAGIATPTSVPLPTFTPTAVVTSTLTPTPTQFFTPTVTPFIP